MVNFGLKLSEYPGYLLAVAGDGLYFLRSVRPELSRDHDIFFAAVYSAASPVPRLAARPNFTI